MLKENLKTEYKGVAKFNLGEFTEEEKQAMAINIIFQNDYAVGKYKYLSENGELITGTFVPEIKYSEGGDE